MLGTCPTQDEMLKRASTSLAASLYPNDDPLTSTMDTGLPDVALDDRASYFCEHSHLCSHCWWSRFWTLRTYAGHKVDSL